MRSALFSLWMVLACTHGTSGGAAPEADRKGDEETREREQPEKLRADSLRGIVREFGSEPLPVLILQSIGPGNQAALEGNLLPLLELTVGLEIVVRGKFAREEKAAAGPGHSRTFNVVSFDVRRADGVDAYDGVVELSDGRYGLRLSDNSWQATPFLPTTLKQRVGSRVFVAGTLGDYPQSYGILSAPKH